jgi:hypothetical protein
LFAIVLVTNKNGNATESLGTRTLEFASICRPVATTNGTLGLVVHLLLLMAFGFGNGYGFPHLGHLFHSSIKEIIFTLPKASLWIRLEISFNATLEFIDGFWFEIGIDTGELVDQGCGSFATNASCLYKERIELAKYSNMLLLSPYTSFSIVHLPVQYMRTFLPCNFFCVRSSANHFGNSILLRICGSKSLAPPGGGAKLPMADS